MFLENNELCLDVYRAIEMIQGPTAANMPGMLLLRYQRQLQEDGGAHREPSSHEMRRKINNHDLKGDGRRAATRGTLICIFICGSLLLSLGLAILFVGLLAPIPRKDPTPWLVIGPTCIVLGILVLLLSVEIILKLRKIASSRGDEPDSPVKKAEARKSWGGLVEGSQGETTQMVPKTIPVIIHPATPLQPLDAAALPGNVVQHR